MKKLSIDINSGAALLFWALGFFAIMFIAKIVVPVAQNIIGIHGAWTVGVSGFWLKRHGDNQNELEARKAGFSLNGPPAPPGGPTP